MVDQVLTDRLDDLIDKQDLDDVKVYVEDNPLITDVTIIAAKRKARELGLISIAEYLDQKFEQLKESTIRELHALLNQVLGSVDIYFTQR